MSKASGKLRILIYGEYFLPVVGGVQSAMNLLAKGLVGLNSRREKDDDIGQIEVTVATMTAANGMDDSVSLYRVVRRPGFLRLVKLIREADVIHVAGPCLLPMAISWLIGKPFVVEHHGYQAICPNGLLFLQPAKVLCPGHFMLQQYGKCLRCCAVTMGSLGSFRSFLLTFPRRWLAKKAAANITITDHVATRVKLPRSRTVYYGIEEAGTVGAAEIPSRPRTLKIAYVGRLVFEKGPAVLLHAAKALNKKGTTFKLVFVGDGPERNSLEELTDSLGLRRFVKFTGDLRGSHLVSAVSNIDVVVMPSIMEETAGLSAIEQMMRGKVVIAADIGGLSEVVADAGLKFAPSNALALASCIQQLIDNPALMTSLGSVARNRAMQVFNLESMIRNHVAVYQEVSR